MNSHDQSASQSSSVADTVSDEEDQRSAAPPSFFARLKRWFSARQERFGWYGLAVAVFLLLLWPYSIVTVDSGHVGVLYRRFMGGTVMDRVYLEGTHLVWPWDTMHIFDGRIHEELHTFSVLTKNGLLLEVDISVLYHPISLLTPVLLTNVGKNYREKLVLPMLLSSVRQVASGFKVSDFYSDTSSLIQDAIHVSVTESMGRNPISIDNLLIRAVRLPEHLSLAINEKMIAEQEVLRQVFKVQEAEQRYKVKFIDAEAVRMSQEIVNRNMTESFLRWQGIEATKDIAKSPNTKFVIAGGRDGLPIILNPDASPVAKPAPLPPAESSPPVPAVLEENDTWSEQAQSYLERVRKENLDRLGKQLENVLQK
jgi:regulator of protease activity HflC (stomatin/prohibitin superfamily)